MISVCLVLLMTLSVVSAGFHWGTTGNAVKKLKDGDEINLYSDAREISVGGNVYEIRAKGRHDSLVDRNKVEIEVKRDGSWTTLCNDKEKGDECYLENVVISVKSITNPFWRSGYRARLRINVDEDSKKSKCFDETQCHVYEGEEISLTIDGKEYTVGVNYLDSDEVKLNINGEITNKLGKGQIQKLEDGSVVIIKTLFVQDYVGGSRFVAFEINSGRSYCSGNACALHEGDTLIYEKDTFEIHYIDSDEVKLMVNGGKGLTKKLNVGMTGKIEGLYIKINEINALEVVDGEKYVLFSVTPVSISGEVTYAGVLEMLNSCEVVNENNEKNLGFDCNRRCSEEGKNCIGGTMDWHAASLNDKSTLQNRVAQPVDCNKNYPSTHVFSMYCICC